jgi:cytochrome c oxidase subunit I+III
VLIFLIDLARNFRPTGGKNAGNVWNAGTLEWLPNGLYGTRSVPLVQSREPLWGQPGLADEVEAGRHYLPNAPTGRRSTLVTSAFEARPDYVLELPGPGWSPLLAALGTAGFFLLLTFKLEGLAAACGILAVAMILLWLWDADTAPHHPPVDIGGGLRLPVSCSGSASHSWWAMVILVIVCASIFASVMFAYLFLWTTSPEVWPAPGSLPGVMRPLASAGLLLASSGLVAWMGRRLEQDRQAPLRLGFPPALLMLVAAVALEGTGHWHGGLRPQDSGYAAAVYALVGLQALFVVVSLFMGLFTVARSMAGRLSAARRSAFDSTMIFWHYTVAQGVLALGLVHGFPRLAG